MGNISQTPFTPAPAIISDDGGVLTAQITTTLAANAVYLRAFTIYATTTIVAAGYRMGATTTGKTNLGIYTLAGNLVSGSDTGQVTNVASSDNKFTYGSAIVLAQGQYFLALSPSNGSDTYMARVATVGTTNGSYRIAANTLSAGALPATTGALSITTLDPISALYTQNGLS